MTDGKASPVAVLSYLFWKKQFDASRDVLGKSIELDHKLYTIIGVAAPRFTWGDSDVYVPYIPTGDPKDYRNSFIKLKPGVTLEAAQRRAASRSFCSFRDRDPKGYPPVTRIKVVTLNEQVLGQFSGTLMLLFGAVTLLLVIGCANVSILMLARGTARMHELALRSSMGASRWRIMRQLLTESVLLSLAGAVIGVLLAFAAVKWIAAALPFYSFPHEAAIHVSVPVLAFSVAIAVLTGISVWHVAGASTLTPELERTDSVRFGPALRRRRRQQDASSSDCRPGGADARAANHRRCGYASIPHRLSRASWLRRR